MDSKSPEWRDAADKLLEALARDNKYIVSDMLIVFLESGGYGLDNYSALGWVFRRGVQKGIIKRVDKDLKPVLWISTLHKSNHQE